MQQSTLTERRGRLAKSAMQTLASTATLLPTLFAAVLLTGLLLQFLPAEAMVTWFGRNQVLDALTGALAGSVAAGHPMASYVIGGELPERGVSLVAVTAFLVSWVTVGSILSCRRRC